MNTLEFLISLRPAIPMSVEKPCSIMSNSELIRLIQNGSILINGRPIKNFKDEPSIPVISLVFSQNQLKKQQYGSTG